MLFATYDIKLLELLGMLIRENSILWCGCPCAMISSSNLTILVELEVMSMKDNMIFMRTRNGYLLQQQNFVMSHSSGSFLALKSGRIPKGI